MKCWQLYKMKKEFLVSEFIDNERKQSYNTETFQVKS